jgi:hypothetical protein
MRMWQIPPKLLCRKHLIGEHVEMHMFIGTIKKGKSIKGYLDKGLVDVPDIIYRHNNLAEEMISRGYNHKSEMGKEASDVIDAYIKKHYPYKLYSVNVYNNLEDLSRRCEACKERIETVTIN